MCVAKHAQTSLGISWADQLTVPAAAAGALHHAQPPPAAWPGHGDTVYTLTHYTVKGLALELGQLRVRFISGIL